MSLSSWLRDLSSASISVSVLLASALARMSLLAPGGNGAAAGVPAFAGSAIFGSAIADANRARCASADPANNALSSVVACLAFAATLGMVSSSLMLSGTSIGGTVGVGRATTAAVVVGSIAVLISDFFLTKLMVAL